MFIYFKCGCSFLQNIFHFNIPFGLDFSRISSLKIMIVQKISASNINCDLKKHQLILLLINNPGRLRVARNCSREI